jgi:hypothetical protein
LLVLVAASWRLPRSAGAYRVVVVQNNTLHEHFVARDGKAYLHSRLGPRTAGVPHYQMVHAY